MTNEEINRALYCAIEVAEETICEEYELYKLCDNSTRKDIAHNALALHCSIYYFCDY